ncbi:MAG: murein L,D-transpeptidase catalytic domain family protein [Bdellovibrio sp.]
MLNGTNSLFSRFRTTVLFTFSVLAITACAKSPDNMVLPDDPTKEKISPQPNKQEEKLPQKEPDSNISDSEKHKILESYDYLDPKQIVPYKALEKAVLYFHLNKSSFKNQDYISVINFGQSSKEKRFYIISLKTGTVWAIHVAHGKGSDANHDGYAEKFSNVSGSEATSLGVYRTAETYTGKHGLSLLLDGLSSTNSNARSRQIVLHGADYVKENNTIQGRSWGCPAVAMEYRDDVIKFLKNGSLIYATVDNGGTKRPSGPSSPTISTGPSTEKENETVYKMTPLAWESSKYPEREQWSQYLMKIVLEDWKSLLKGSEDMTDFCPRYNTLSDHDRANVWAQLFASMTRYESNFNPLTRLHEKGKGNDPVTHQPVYSEGLLQLSYQDTLGYDFCKFQWSKDKNLTPYNPEKTILDPYRNLYCGVGIMAKQIERKDKIKIGSDAYWAVLKTSYSKNKISSITQMVKSLPMCE